MADRNPLTVSCPNCQAKPGQPCTQPTDTGRKAVSWCHLARSVTDTGRITRSDTPTQLARGGMFAQDELRP